MVENAVQRGSVLWGHFLWRRFPTDRALLPLLLVLELGPGGGEIWDPIWPKYHTLIFQIFFRNNNKSTQTSLMSKAPTIAEKQSQLMKRAGKQLTHPWLCSLHQLGHVAPFHPASNVFPYSFAPQRNLSTSCIFNSPAETQAWCGDGQWKGCCSTILILFPHPVVGGVQLSAQPPPGTVASTYIYVCICI